jgi:opacity protein-like surface antigen
MFALVDLLLFSQETQMIPYVQGRVGWMQLSNDSDGVSTKISGLELAALVGVDMPVAESISIDVSGQFGWFSGGDLTVDGISDPGTSRSGTLFSIRAGAFFFF